MFYASVLALPACETHHERDAFASRADHNGAIDKCLNEDLCDTLCEAMVAPEHQVDLYEIERCDIVSESPEGLDMHVEYTVLVACGRRPIGFVESGRRAGVGGWLATVATLEAASITAFARLADALVRFGAPASFVARARAAIADERRHARAIARIARLLGATIERPRVVDTTPSLVDLAIDNAVEGQVGETIGALVATCQARSAAAPLRAVFAPIARDEQRHAELAHDLAPWLAAQLDRGDRALVREARRAAIATRGRADVAAGLTDRERAWLGIPSAARQARANAAMFQMMAMA